MDKKVEKQVTITDEPQKKTITMTHDGSPADNIAGKPTVEAHKDEKTAEAKAPVKATEKPAEEQKPHIKVDEDVATADAKPAGSTDEKLDRLIALLEQLLSTEGEEQEVEPATDESAYEDGVDAKAEEDEEEDEDECVDEKASKMEDEAPKAEAVPIVEDEKVKEEAAEKEEDACAKVAKLEKTVKKGALLNKIKAVVEPLAKENKLLKEKIAKLEKEPLPRKDAPKEAVKPVKVEKYQEVKLEKKETTFSEDLTKDIDKASSLRKSGKVLSQDEEAFCKRVAEKMLDEKLSK